MPPNPSGASLLHYLRWLIGSQRYRLSTIHKTFQLIAPFLSVAAIDPEEEEEHSEWMAVKTMRNPWTYRETGTRLREMNIVRV